MAWRGNAAPTFFQILSKKPLVGYTDRQPSTEPRRCPNPTVPHPREEVLELFRFIDWLLNLPAELEQRFQDELEAYEATMSTPYVTTIERRGIEQGIQQDIQRGKTAQARESLQTILEARFGQLPDTLRQQIAVLDDLDTLEALLKTAATADALEAVQKQLPAS